MDSTDHGPFAAVREPRRLAWALLSRAARGPSKPVWRLIEQLGVEDAATALTTGTAGIEIDPAASRDCNRLIADRDVIAVTSPRDIYLVDGALPTEPFA